MVALEKDKKGNAYIVTHTRCGFNEQIFLTAEELHDLRKILNEERF